MPVDANEVVSFLWWLSSVIAAAGVVFGAIYKVLNAMVTKKIQSQLRATVRELTEATSASIDALRAEVREQREENESRSAAAEERLERRLEGVTRRIDDMLGRLGSRGGS